MKKNLAILGIAALAFVFTGAADAAVIKNINDSSSATSMATWLIDVLMNNKNGAILLNDVSTSANSGANSFTSADDQSGTSIDTGDTVSATLVDNSANANALTEDYQSVDGADNTIEDVDDSSAATADSDDTLLNDMINDNDVIVDNDVAADSDSGSNTVVSGDSLSDSGATTGGADAASVVVNLFNINLKDIVRTMVSF